MTKITIIITAIALLFLITTIVFIRLYFKQKKKTEQEKEKAISAETKTENLKWRVLENESFQKNNNADSFNASIDILHDLSKR